MTLSKPAHLLLLAAVLACNASSKSIGQGSDSEDSTADGTTTDDTDPSVSSTTVVTVSTSGSSSTTDTTATDPSSSGTDESTGTDTTVGGVCDLQELICQAAEGKEEPVDCGALSLEDTLDDWLAGRDCVLQNVASTSAFKIVAEMQGIDSNIAEAWGGTVGVVYGTMHIFWDDYGGVEIARLRNCETIAGLPNCDPAVGNLCLMCVNESEPIDLCE